AAAPNRRPRCYRPRLRRPKVRRPRRRRRSRRRPKDRRRGTRRPKRPARRTRLASSLRVAQIEPPSEDPPVAPEARPPRIVRPAPSGPGGRRVFDPRVAGPLAAPRARAPAFLHAVGGEKSMHLRREPRAKRPPQKRKLVIDPDPPADPIVVDVVRAPRLV